MNNEYPVLIIDDETAITDLISEYLTDCGYKTFCANDIASAIKFLEKKPNLILLDINMPNTDGLEFCKTVRDIISCPLYF